MIEALALEKPRRSVAAICRIIGTLPENGQSRSPGYTTVSRIVSAIDPALVSLAHEGGKVYSEQGYFLSLKAPSALQMSTPLGGPSRLVDA